MGEGGLNKKELISIEGNWYLLSTFCVLGSTDVFAKFTYYFHAAIPQIFTECLSWVCHCARNTTMNKNKSPYTPGAYYPM